jgi:hypothetical protein
MNPSRLLPLLLLLTPELVLGAPAYERPILLGDLPSAQPVFVAVPTDVLAEGPIANMRIMQGTMMLPMKTVPPKGGELQKVIASVTPCSIDGNSPTGVLHDGDPETSLRPDPLRDPTSCVIDIRFSAPLRVNEISIDASSSITNLAISAHDRGTYVRLREVKNAALSSFSEVETDVIRLTLSYDVVPPSAKLHFQARSPHGFSFRLYQMERTDWCMEIPLR